MGFAKFRGLREADYKRRRPTEASVVGDGLLQSAVDIR